MLTGIFSSLLIPETAGKSLEELSRETDEQPAYESRKADSDDGIKGTY
jgi:PHS family inorganic phosphate transporter-like MFS transporter